MVDLRQSESYAKYIKSLGWQVDKVSSVYSYSKKFPLIGSIIKIQRPKKKIDINNLDKLAKKRRAFSIYIESSDDNQLEYYINNGFSKTKSPSLPSKTVQINLLKREKTLLSNMHRKTRYGIRAAIKKGVKVKETTDIRKFADMWQISAKKRGMFLSQKNEILKIYNAFKGNSKIYFAYKEKRLLGGVLILSTKTTSYYMYAASTLPGNKLSAPTLLVWEAIRFSKERKKNIFDFEGIYDDRFPLKSWVGFSRFKKSFAGEEVIYPPPLRKLYFPI